MSARRQIIRGGLLLDSGAREAVPLDLLLAGDRIEALLPPGAPVPPDAQEFDATDRLLIPGLVDAHTHSHQNIMRGTADRWTLEMSLTAGPWVAGERDHEQVYLSAVLGAAELVLKGCTACYDLIYEYPLPSAAGVAATAQAYRDVGIRAVLAPMIGDRTFYDAVPGLLDALPDDLKAIAERFEAAPAAEALAACRAAFADWGYDRTMIAPAIAPTIPHHCTDDFIIGCRDLARDLGIRLHMHLAESKIQVLAGVARYGKSLTAHIDGLGLIGPDFTAAHAIWLDADDMARLGAKGATVAHMPGSNFRLGCGMAAAEPMRRHGVTVAIATDGATSSDALNMFQAMRLASYVSRARGRPPEEWLGSVELLRMATQASAAALGLGDQIGQLKPGFKADIAFLDLGHLNYWPLNDAPNQVVNCEDGTGVHSVMVGGRLVVRDRKLLTLDLAALRGKVSAARERLAAKAHDLRALADRLTPHVAAFGARQLAQPHPVDRYVD